MHKPDIESRAKVRALSAYGIRQDDIARYLDVAPKTLRQHYRDELDIGGIEANAKVAEGLFKMATNGNTAAAIFWLKSRAGWREVQQIDLNHRSMTDLGDDELIERAAAIVTGNDSTPSGKV